MIFHLAPPLPQFSTTSGISVEIEKKMFKILLCIVYSSTLVLPYRVAEQTALISFTQEPWGLVVKLPDAVHDYSSNTHLAYRMDTFDHRDRLSVWSRPLQLKFTVTLIQYHHLNHCNNSSSMLVLLRCGELRSHAALHHMTSPILLH